MRLVQEEGLSLTLPYYISADGNVPVQLLRLLEIVSMGDDVCQGGGKDIGDGEAKNKALHSFISHELQNTREALNLLLLEKDIVTLNVKSLKSALLEHRIKVLQRTIEKTLCFFRLVK